MNKLIDVKQKDVKILKEEAKKMNLKVKPFIEFIIAEKVKEFLSKSKNGSQSQ